MTAASTATRTDTEFIDFVKFVMTMRGWSVAQFAAEVGVHVQLAYKWLAENPRYRTIPSPASCEKIARAVDEDVDAILSMVGHRPSSAARQDGTDESAALSALISMLRQRWDVLDEAEQRAITAVVRTLTGTPLEMR